MPGQMCRMMTWFDMAKRDQVRVRYGNSSGSDQRLASYGIHEYALAVRRGVWPLVAVFHVGCERIECCSTRISTA